MSSVVEVCMIRRLLIANRGEIALRIIRACREMGIESVAIYSDADKGAPHALAADRAIAIGPAAAAQSYLVVDKVIAAARECRAGAIHPGYGFLSENAAFARACTDAGLTFVGPPADAIDRMGSKIEARRLVSTAGVPIVPGETPDDQSDAGVGAAATRVGLPVLIKASAGGGGKGMRRVTDAAALDESIQAARREALAAFGDGTLYVERLVDRPRHVEVQVFADRHGDAVHLFERECSVQRRHQKVIEESPSPVLTPELRARMTDAAVRATRSAGYVNAGTIEFLVDGPNFYFLEMNTRLQVEHPVTEQVVGVDLVRAQLVVASSGRLPWTQDQLSQRGHAIEARVYAEDPANGFLPQAGSLTRYVEPRRPGVRVDAGVGEGSTISVFYDPMIAKVIATAETRALAIDRLAAALREFVVEGVKTNIPFLLTLLARDEFRGGNVDTAFLDREKLTVDSSQSTSPAQSAIRIPQSAISFDPWDGANVAKAERTTEPTKRRTSGAAGHAVTAPMPATVVKVHVAAGDAVKKGDALVVLEAMKMELPIRAPGDAIVKTVCCKPGEMVAADAVLVEFDAQQDHGR
jgi:acetyl-CoA carboxylase biotin carboxylase subunit